MDSKPAAPDRRLVVRNSSRPPRVNHPPVPEPSHLQTAPAVQAPPDIVSTTRSVPRAVEGILPSSPMTSLDPAHDQYLGKTSPAEVNRDLPGDRGPTSPKSPGLMAAGTLKAVGTAVYHTVTKPLGFAGNRRSSRDSNSSRGSSNVSLDRLLGNVEAGSGEKEEFEHVKGEETKVQTKPPARREVVRELVPDLAAVLGIDVPLPWLSPSVSTLTLPKYHLDYSNPFFGLILSAEYLEVESLEVPIFYLPSKMADLDPNFKLAGNCYVSHVTEGATAHSKSTFSLSPSILAKTPSTLRELYSSNSHGRAINLLVSVASLCQSLHYYSLSYPAHASQMRSLARVIVGSSKDWVKVGFMIPEWVPSLPAVKLKDKLVEVKLKATPFCRHSKILMEYE